MRLPTVTAEHRQNEDARQQHEALYLAYQTGNSISRPITPDTAVKIQGDESGNIRRFWHTRGFRVRTRTNREKTWLTIWIEPKS